MPYFQIFVAVLRVMSYLKLHTRRNVQRLKSRDLSCNCARVGLGLSINWWIVLKRSGRVTIGHLWNSK